MELKPVSETRYLLLHSSLSSGRQWQALTSQLPEGRSHTPDLLGYGAAMQIIWTPRQVSLEEEMAAIIKQLPEDWQETPWHLIGHSYGAVNALQLAYSFPEQFQSLALFEPVAFSLLPEGREKQEVLQLVEELNAHLDRGQDDRAAEGFIDYWNQPGHFSQLPAEVRAAFTLGVHKVMADFHALMTLDWSLDELAERLHQPCLLMQGRESRSTAHEVIKQLAKHLPRSSSIEFSGGHMAPLTQARQVNQTLLQFLECPE
ncbi:alpha/beta fold hydrolase [Marinospirillum perlucidum]|uniref:alpha/beta fold hydrolase n=1 Tax=Marinospirillum perlucidum TaxID=1982602 RepID=UPI000DF13947|nr:alpha/beta hydrolase [Marinospirillum perlucidum]